MDERSIKFTGVDKLILFMEDRPSLTTHIKGWKGFVNEIMHPGKDEIPSKKEIPGFINRKVRDKASSVLVSDDPLTVGGASGTGLAMVIGIPRNTPGKRDLYEAGADLVLNEPGELEFSAGEGTPARYVQSLPSAFSELHKFHLPFGLEKAIFIFDYDGTLSPIVNDPSRAVLDSRNRTLLRELSLRSRVAIVSGRDRDDIRDFIGLGTLIYAGSHGFRISGPDGLYMEHPEGEKILSELDQVEETVRSNLEEKIRGVEVERKRYAIAIHYRNAPPGADEEVKDFTSRLASRSEGIKTGEGKMIVELKPATEWHKGKAVEWIMEELGIPMGAEVTPIYVGDDHTDEDAFRTIADAGIGILVGGHERPTAAHFHLEDTSQVTKFMHFQVQSS